MPVGCFVIFKLLEAAVRAYNKAKLGQLAKFDNLH